MCETVETEDNCEVLSFPKILLFCSKVFSSMWTNPEFKYTDSASLIQHSFTHTLKSSRLQTRFSRKQICPHTQTFTLAAVTRRNRSVCTVRMHIRHNTRFPVWKINDHSKTDSERGGMLRYECFSASWLIIYVFSTWAYSVFPKNRKRKQRCKKIEAKKMNHKKESRDCCLLISIYPLESCKKETWLLRLLRDASRFWEKKVFYVHHSLLQLLFLVRKSEKEMQLSPWKFYRGVKSLSQLICIIPLPVFWLSCIQLFVRCADPGSLLINHLHVRLLVLLTL